MQVKYAILGLQYKTGEKIMEFKIGDILEGEIIDFTHEGNGLMKIDNFAIFVQGGVIGDKVEIEITELKKNFGKALIRNIIEASPDRVNEEIKALSGATPLINYDYNKQLQWKKDKVKNDLNKFAGLSDIKVNDTIAMENPYGYRNHIQIPVGLKDGKAVLGFFERGSHDVVEMDKSILLPGNGEEILLAINKWINTHNIRPYNRSNNRGVLRHIGIRTNKAKEAMVIIVTKTRQIPNKEELISALRKVNSVVSIYHNINEKRNGPTYGNKYIKLFGQEKLLDYLGKFKFKISPDSFFQVNRSQAEILYNKAMEYLNPNDEDTVFDLYCGIGTISLYIADKAKMVYGIESVKSAIEDAKINAQANKIEKADFILGKAEEVFPELMNQDVVANKLVVDPPRKGCEKQVLEAISKLLPETIVYVSCNPSTMARDVGYLLDNGYVVKEVQPVDMFPHTAHVECVIEIQKVQSSK